MYLSGLYRLADTPPHGCFHFYFDSSCASSQYLKYISNTFPTVFPLLKSFDRIQIRLVSFKCIWNTKYIWTVVATQDTYNT